MNKMMAVPILALCLLCASGAGAAGVRAGGANTGEQPIEISADNLEVLQAVKQAIFTGNVIAVQGERTLRAEKMIVFYDQESSAVPAKTTPPPAKAAGDGKPPGSAIKRIEASGKVVFTAPEESALGDFAIYNTVANTIDLTGSKVVLTRAKNILVGTALNYNLTTGRSVLTSSSGAEVAQGGTSRGGRVHGLFVPQKKAIAPASAAPVAPAK